MTISHMILFRFQQVSSYSEKQDVILFYHLQIKRKIHEVLFHLLPYCIFAGKHGLTLLPHQSVFSFVYYNILLKKKQQQQDYLLQQHYLEYPY